MFNVVIYLQQVRKDSTYGRMAEMRRLCLKEFTIRTLPKI